MAAKPQPKPAARKNGARRLSDFKPQRRNSNRGNQAGLRELDKSIRRDGYSAPMVAAADGEIFAGSKRLERVADVYGVDVEPIIVHSDGKHPVIHIRDDIATADDPRAVRLGVADNVVAHLDYDPDGELLALLAAEDAAIAEMVKADELSLKATLEFTQGEPQDAEPQIDRAEELREKWQTERGQLWAIGEHRLLCGDSTNADDVARVMGGEKAGACVTDPPYNIGKDFGEYNDKKSDEEYIRFCGSWFDIIPTLKIAIFTGSLKCGLWWQVNPPRAVVAWIKRNGQGHNPFGGTTKWEPILFWSPPHDLDTDIIEHNNEYGEKISTLHITPKPVGLIEKIAIRFGESVLYEPFAGSGTTLVACQNLARRCRAIEISPAYVAVCIERMATAFPGIDIHLVN